MHLLTNLRVRFGGGRAGVAPATRGQTNLLLCMQSGTFMCLDAVLPLAHGTAPEEVADALRRLVLRHEALRTLFRFGDPALQIVVGHGELTLAVYDAGDTPPERRVEAVREVHWVRPFSDVQTDLPIKAAVLCVDGVPAYAAVAVSHVIADAIGLTVVMEELETLIGGGELPPAGAQPLDLVADEQVPASRRKLKRALDYWRRILETSPHTMFPVVAVDDDEPCHTKLAIRSTDIAKAMERAARRAGVSAATVVMTAFTVLTAHRCGLARCPVYLPTSNRFRLQLQGHVGQLASDSLMVVDLGGVSGFDAAARLVLRDSLRAYWFSQYDSVALWDLFARVAHERGLFSHAREIVFSNMVGPERGRYGQLGVPSPRPADPSRRDSMLWHRLSNSMSWLEDEPHVSHVSLDVFSLTDEFVAVLQGAPTCFTRADVVDYAWALERLLLAVGDGDVDLAELTAVSGLAPIPRTGQWLRTDGGWVDLTAVQAILRSVAGETSYVIAVPDEPLGHRVVGHVAHAAQEATPEHLHAAFVAALPLQGGAMTPHEYVIHSPKRITGTGRAWS